MKLHYAGKYSGNPDDLPYLEHEPGAVQFKEAKDLKQLSKIMFIVALVIIAALLVLTWLRAGEYFIGSGSVILYLLTIIPHELLHAICYKGDVYLYQNLGRGMVFVSGAERMIKNKFIFKCLLPVTLLGFIPYILFMINPELRTLGTLGALVIGSAAGDFYNVFNALRQTPKDAWIYNHKENTFWYIPGKQTL
jgi:hypothetical protein